MSIIVIKIIYGEFTASFHVSLVNGKYILITTDLNVGRDQGKEIYAYTSATPFGPFSNKTTKWTVDDTAQGYYPFFYLASAHPECDNGKNKFTVNLLH